MKLLNILLLSGSIRAGRQTPKAASVIKQKLENIPDTEITFLDLAELNLPLFTDEEPTGAALKLLEAYKKADGIIIVTPEYNHGLPSSLKNAIDFARDKELYGKPLAQVGVSNGPYGGVRAIKELAHVWHGVGGITLPVFLPTPMIEEFDAQNPPEKWLDRADGVLEKAVYWFRVIRDGKENNA